MKSEGIAQLKLKENEQMALQEMKQELLEKFPDMEIILYGSKARREEEKFSDIDLLILVDSQINRNLKEKIGEVKYQLELKYDVVFGTIVENRNFWKSPLAMTMPLHWNIDRDGIRL